MRYELKRAIWRKRNCLSLALMALPFVASAGGGSLNGVYYEELPESVVSKDAPAVSAPDTADKAAKGLMAGTLIDFDDMTVLTLFADLEAARDEYCAEGVIFSGGGPDDGAA